MQDVRTPTGLLAAVALLSSVTAGLSQEGAAGATAYCAELRHITNLAMTRERFASIIGKPRAGDFRETTMSLTGWNDCAFYGTRAYTCDSPGLASADEAEIAALRIAREITDCLETAWSQVPEQSSRGYLVLHPGLGPASITLNLDRTDRNQHIVRLTLFLRGTAAPR
jgi:hypothetical protein